MVECMRRYVLVCEKVCERVSEVCQRGCVTGWYVRGWCERVGS